MNTPDQPPPETPPRPGLVQRALNTIEWAGNRLPDPAMLFVWALLLTLLTSAFLASVDFDAMDPRTVQRDAAGQITQAENIRVLNQLSGPALATFLARMVKTFIEFPPLGVVLVALLGVGVADQTGFIRAAIRALLNLTPSRWLTPMLLLVAIVSHSAGDTGYVLVIPLGGVIFAAAGRHPLAGIVAAFAGVSGGFSANFLPSSLDPLLQGFTQSAAQIIDPTRTVNPLCNWFFTSASCLVIIGVGTWITDRVIEPRLRNVPVDGETPDASATEPLTPRERRALWVSLGAVGLGLGGLTLAAWPAGSPLRSASGSLTAHGAPLMDSIIGLIFLLFLVPGVTYGIIVGTVRNHRDVIKAMSHSMSTMGYYLVMAFAAAQFTYVFRESNLGALLAVKGALFLQQLGLPGQVTIVGIIILSSAVNLLVGSASAKWAFLGPIFVPMLMQLGLSPELTQAAYRVGDSSTNIITPLLPYFPLIVVYAQRYVKRTGIGTLVSLMLPYALLFLISWTLCLLIYWGLGLPLGLQAPYTYP
ncbi:MAG TPA: AbgT family transporter [Verrucomicrobiota bacterium]|nr:MAG: p-aminobenzoyl-glutamate transport protein [Verrucomicrobia bacterium ADurb.Bin118]HPY30751.1 AbgT family transporter [Verrucomicrobiota bacterium]HQB17157.1 AbgT family transporter [Verrucomicrobiota bacterium]